MADLLLSNVASDTSDAEIRDFLVKYGFPQFDAIEHLPGDGSRPSVLLTFKDTAPETLYKLRERVQNLFWKDRKISVQVMTERFS